MHYDSVAFSIHKIGDGVHNQPRLADLLQISKEMLTKLEIVLDAVTTVREFHFDLLLAASEIFGIIDLQLGTIVDKLVAGLKNAGIHLETQRLVCA